MGSLLALIPAISGIIEKVIPDPQKQMELRAELTKAAMDAESELYKARGSIITAEAQGESWMQRNWRPITMLTFVFIIANNYILAPYMSFFSSAFGWIDETGAGVTVPTLAIPDGMWGLLQIGIGGYIASRGIEKTVKSGGLRPKNAVTRDDLEEDRKKLLEELRGV